jgi:hypothetical protein
MKIIKVCILFLLFNSYTLKAQYQINPELWKVVFEDDFSSKQLDTNKWYTYFAFDGGDTLMRGVPDTCRLLPENIQLQSDNTLALYSKLDEKSPFKEKGSTALIRTTFDEYPIQYDKDKYPGGFLFGRIEIRCKLSALPGQFPALWLSGNNAWPPEIDIIEGYTGNRFPEISNNIFWEHQSNEQHFYKIKKRELKQFHVFELVWTPDRVSFFMDGKELRSNTDKAQFMWKHCESVYEMMRWCKMDLLIQSNFNYPKSAYYDQYQNDPFVIDYVKIYKPKNLAAFDPSDDLLTYYVNQLLPVYRSIDDAERDRNQKKSQRRKPFKVILSDNIPKTP